jgi:cytochrome c2
MKKIDRRLIVFLLLLVGISLLILASFKRDMIVGEIIKPQVKFILRKINVIRFGEEHYIQSLISKQYAKVPAVDSLSSSIETSVLPIKLQSMFIAKVGGFPEGAGAITNIRGKLVVLDRMGGIYEYGDSKIKKLDYGVFPNRLKEYILYSHAYSLGFNALRAHSIAYDSLHSKIYVSYEKYVNPSFNQFVISSLQIDGNTLQKKGNWELVFETGKVPSEFYSQGAGGKLLISSGTLYFSVGYAVESRVNGVVKSSSQDIRSPFGKIYEYSLLTKKLNMKSLGHRNSQGLAILEDGKLLNVEHGPQGGDEINLVENGKNYGWPLRTYGTNYGAYNWEFLSERNNHKFTEPLYAFVPSVGISGIFLVHDFHERWNGDLLVTSLKAQSLFRIKLIGNRVVFSEPIWIGHRIRDISNVGDKIVLLTDDSSLIFMSVSRDSLLKNSKFAGYNFEPKITVCLQCHHFEQTTPSSVAPSLAHILNRKIASDNFLHYSDALKNKRGKWTRGELIKFIENPNEFAKGSGMPNLGLSSSEVEDIVDILSK